MDCDNAEGAVYPGAPEVMCDGVDNDCDGMIDERCPWNRITDGGYDTANSIIPGSNGGYLIAGRTRNAKGGPGVTGLISKIGETGNELWNRIFDAAYAGSGFGSVSQGITGGYVLTGFYDLDFNLRDRRLWIVKTDENGNAPALP